MKKIMVTAHQRANAIEARDVMWPSVPQANVFKDLGLWREDSPHRPPSCSTVACFGGWCEWWPEFRRQIGLAADSGSCGWSQVTGLFGPESHREIHELLSTRWSHAADETLTSTASDHEVITNRLNWLLANTEVRP